MTFGSDSPILQGLLFWLFKWGFKVSSGTSECYIEAVLVLTLIILRWRAAEFLWVLSRFFCRFPVNSI